jgi:hypothetical protein
MKKNLLTLVAVTCIVVASQLISCSSGTPPDTTSTISSDSSHKESSHYRPNQVIVMFKRKPTTAEVTNLQSKIHGPEFDASALTTKKCKSCKGYIELWEAPNIHSRIHADGLAAGSRPPGGSKGVGEDGLAYYSVNFMQNIPMDSMEKKFKDFDYSNFKKVNNDTSGKEVVRIAVLDTGIDTQKIISTSYRWTNRQEVSAGALPQKDDDGNCYNDDNFGWNFIDNNNDVSENNPDFHGTLVSHYIINEFAASKDNAVEIMTLKTHDSNGRGDLFSSICAIHYAMENGANIINASWGFYYYEDRPHPYLEKLITEVLKDQGILFVAAAGNKDQVQDIIAQSAHYIPANHLRNLEYHKFYPACLSTEDNNVLTITTADTVEVSPTQNYSSKYVDLGAMPDEVTSTSMKFMVPFNGPVGYISGSSFAAAIATGKIGAFLPTSFYQDPINKTKVIANLDLQQGVPGMPMLITRSSSLGAKKIRNGLLTRHK